MNVVRRASRVRAGVRWAVTIAGLAVTVAACGPLQLGAAAIYGQQRITAAKLADEVANLNTAYQADKARVHIGYGPADMPREVLTWMLRFATRERLAQLQHITVTPAQSQFALSEVQRSVKQSGTTLPVAATSAGLPPDMLSGLGRYVAIETVLQNRLDHGVPPSTAAENQALTAELAHLECRAAKSLAIKVNPQYGALDYSQYVVVPTASTLAAAGPPAKTNPGTKPELTPAC